MNKPTPGPKQASTEHINLEDIQRHIKNLLLENVKLDDIYNYISVSYPSHIGQCFSICFQFSIHFSFFIHPHRQHQANVTEINNNFIRALTSAVVDSSLDNRYKLNEKQFLQRIPLLERYIDGSEQSQVQCLIAIQILINRLEHPQGK